VPPAIPVALPIPAALAPFIATMTIDALGGRTPAVHVDEETPGCHAIRLTFELEEEVTQDDWRLAITPAFVPRRWWAPHLTPTADHVIDQHVFRAPAVLAADATRLVALVPDLANFTWSAHSRWYLDLDAPGRQLVLGTAATIVDGHVFFRRTTGARHAAGRLVVPFFVFSAEGDVDNPWRRLRSFMWRRWASAPVRSGAPVAADLRPFVDHAYGWAFERWRDAVWQELELDGRRVGAPTFIVNHTQSPSYGGEVDEREMRSVWNQVWFSSLRSASGLYRHARRKHLPALERSALLTKELALAAPQRGGLFPAVLACEMTTVARGGSHYRRSRGWHTARWGNSDRNPVNRPAHGSGSGDLRVAPFHLADMSFTALTMLRWYRELEPDPRLVRYPERYAARLVALQDAGGFFPAWLDAGSERPLEELAQSVESALSATFLLTLAAVTRNERWRRSALLAVDAVASAIVPQGRWEDFETYWSCAGYGRADLVGTRVSRNAMFKQSNLGMFWMAEALLAAYDAIADEAYLELGRRVIDELLMTQAAWQAPYLPVDTFGGFGVMNADGEWNDARASLFAELLVDYGVALEEPELVERGIAALRSSFAMMFCPENRATQALWHGAAPHFGAADHGFTMENYGHGGRTDDARGGLDTFCIYDWGPGAAAEAYERIVAHHGSALVLGATLV
jgi:hypothetical protein